MAGKVRHDEFRAFTVNDARHLSYLLRQRRARSQARPEDIGSAYREASPADPSPGHSYSECEILVELGLE